MRQVPIIGSEPHSRYFLSSLVDLRHYLVFNDRCLDIDGEIADLEAGLQLEACFIRSRVHVTAKLGWVDAHGFVT